MHRRPIWRSNHAVRKERRLAVQGLLHRFVARTFRRGHLYLVRAMAYSSFDMRSYTHERDLVRLASLYLVSSQVDRQRIVGEVAELGVYRGAFARHINQAFPDRHLYLFDTYEGFSSEDQYFDRDSGYSPATQDFSITSAELVLGRMPHAENVRIVHGQFPESAHGIPPTTFAFVSIDVDLYRPTVAGLEFFYPRLSPGGYIFVHDYYNEEYRGVRDAVDAYAGESGAATFPLPDTGGTMVICRPPAMFSAAQGARSNRAPYSERGSGAPGQR